MGTHSKFTTFFRKPAFVGLTLFGGTFFFLFQIFYWQRIYAKPLVRIYHYDSLFDSKGQNKYKSFDERPFELYSSTARKILKAIGKNQIPVSLAEIERKTGLDSLVLMTTLQHFANKSQRQKASVNLNSADSAELEQLPGIGAKTASRIVRYRNRLGGFISKYQLLEIRFFDSGLVVENRIEFKIDTSVIKKIEINQCEIIDLYRHPYIGKSNARQIWNFKNAHYPLNYNTLKQIKGIPEEIIVRLTPYLSFRQKEK